MTGTKIFGKAQWWDLDKKRLGNTGIGDRIMIATKVRSDYGMPLMTSVHTENVVSNKSIDKCSIQFILLQFSF